MAASGLAGTSHPASHQPQPLARVVKMLQFGLHGRGLGMDMAHGPAPTGCGRSIICKLTSGGPGQEDQTKACPGPRPGVAAWLLKLEPLQASRLAAAGPTAAYSIPMAR